MTRLPPTGRGRGRGSGRGGPVKWASAVLHVTGLTPDLKTSIIDYGVKNAAERLKTALKEITTCSGTKYGTDMSTELTSRQAFVVPPPVLPQRNIDENTAAEERLDRKNDRKKTLLENKKAALEAIDDDARTPEQDETLAKLIIEMEDLEDEMLQPFKRTLSRADKLIVDGAYNTYNK